VVAVLIPTMVAGAWAINFSFPTLFSLETAAPEAMPLVGVDNWSCFKVNGGNTGLTIQKCANMADGLGFDVAMFGLSEDDLSVTIARHIRNDGDVPVEVSIGGTHPAELTFTMVDAAYQPIDTIIQPGAAPEVIVLVESQGIGPEQTLNLSGVELLVTDAP